jgi:hypothetical protein
VIANILVVAKAPIPGMAKTRIAATVGPEAAADLAAAALLDTLDVATGCGGPVVVALSGDLGASARSADLGSALAGVAVIPQRGNGFAARLANAHADAAGYGPVVQIGMDTPQISVDDLLAADAFVDASGAAIGLAEDGGWWLLGLADASRAAVLVDVPMSVPETAARTLDAIGGDPPHLRVLRDMDTWDDAVAIAAVIPDSRVAETVKRWA